jgi:hypothetical protein
MASASLFLSPVGLDIILQPESVKLNELVTKRLLPAESSSILPPSPQRTSALSVLLQGGKR